MKTTIKTTLAAMALGATVLMLQAQDTNGTFNGAPPDGGPPDGGPPPGFRHRPPPLPLLRALDVNHDGVIDSNEIANASAALLTLDKNGDGKLTADEYMPPMPKDAPADAPRPPVPLIVKALDANGDGVIDANEIANAPAALKSLDKRGDGQLTRDEYIGRPPMGPRGGGNFGNGGMPAGPPPEGGDSGNGAGGPPPDGAPAGPPPNGN